MRPVFADDVPVTEEIERLERELVEEAMKAWPEFGRSLTEALSILFLPDEDGELP